MRLRETAPWAMLEFVFNGMVFLLLGLQLPGILETSLMAAEIDPNVEIWMLFTDIILAICGADAGPFRLAVDDEKVQQPLPEEEADGVWFVDHTRNPDRVLRRRRGAITLAGVLSIPLLLPDGNVFRRAMSWCSWRLASFSLSLFVGVVMLPILLHNTLKSRTIRNN